MDGINQKNESIRTISLSGTMRGDIETIGKDISAGSSVLKQTTRIMKFKGILFPSVLILRVIFYPFSVLMILHARILFNAMSKRLHGHTNGVSS